LIKYETKKVIVTMNVDFHLLLW